MIRVDGRSRCLPIVLSKSPKLPSVVVSRNSRLLMLVHVLVGMIYAGTLLGCSGDGSDGDIVNSGQSATGVIGRITMGPLVTPTGSQAVTSTTTTSSTMASGNAILSTATAEASTSDTTGGTACATSAIGNTSATDAVTATDAATMTDVVTTVTGCLEPLDFGGDARIL
jgi:type IV secretory pathway TrbL component